MMLISGVAFQKTFFRVGGLALVLVAGTQFLAAAQDTPAANESPSGMFVSIRESLLTDKTFPTTAEGLKQLGISAIELSLDRNFSVHAPDADERVVLGTDEDAKAYRARAEQLGVR